MMFSLAELRALPKIVGFLLLLSAMAVQAKPDAGAGFDVHYRYGKAEHVVVGKKTHSNSFVYNPDAKQHIRLATLDWPPYIGQNTCMQGWVLQYTVALLHHLNYGAKITFYPWARAIHVVETAKADILFPEYYIEPDAPSDVVPGTSRLAHLILSEPFGFGPVAFVKRKGYNLAHYSNLQSLVNESIGVVRGYQNTPEFDRLMDMGSFNIVQARDDLQNVSLLLNGRVNLIVGDPEVIRTQVKDSTYSARRKQQMLAALETVEPIIDMNGLYFAIARQGKQAGQLRLQLNKAIERFKRHGVLADIRQRIAKGCSD